jgi:hypothetical protein
MEGTVAVTHLLADTLKYWASLNRQIDAALNDEIKGAPVASVQSLLPTLLKLQECYASLESLFWSHVDTQIASRSERAARIAEMQARLKQNHGLQAWARLYAQRAALRHPGWEGIRLVRSDLA